MKSSGRYKICLAGKNEIAARGLQLSIDRVGRDKVAVIANRTDGGYDTWQPSLKKKAMELGVAVISIEDVYGIPDTIFLSLEFDRIIDPKRFSSDKLFNIHFSALPAYKGMYTSALPLLNGDGCSGVTLHKMDRGIDTGEIVDQILFSIDEVMSAGRLYREYTMHASNMLEANMDDLLAGKIRSERQSSVGSSYFSRKYIDYENLEINIIQTASQVRNQIRAFSFPEYQMPRVDGCYVSEALITSEPSVKKAGKTLEVTSTRLRVATIDYDVFLTRDKTAELMKAAKENDICLAEDCIGNGATVNWRNGRGWSPLIVASYFGSLDVIDILLDCGAEVDLASYKGTTPAMYAMSFCEKGGGKGPLLKLLNAGADTGLRDIERKSLINYAIERNVVEVIDIL